MSACSGGGNCSILGTAATCRVSCAIGASRIGCACACVPVPVDAGAGRAKNRYSSAVYPLEAWFGGLMIHSTQVRQISLGTATSLADSLGWPIGPSRRIEPRL